MTSPETPELPRYPFYDHGAGEMVFPEPAGQWVDPLRFEVEPLTQLHQVTGDVVCPLYTVGPQDDARWPRTNFESSRLVLRLVVALTPGVSLGDPIPGRPLPAAAGDMRWWLDWEVWLSQGQLAVDDLRYPWGEPVVDGYWEFAQPGEMPVDRAALLAELEPRLLDVMRAFRVPLLRHEHRMMRVAGAALALDLSDASGATIREVPQGGYGNAFNVPPRLAIDLR
jgi:hypothetical protein